CSRPTAPAVTAIRKYTPNVDVNVIIMRGNQFNQEVADFIQAYSGTFADNIPKSRVYIYAEDGNGYTLVDQFVQEFGPPPPNSIEPPNPGNTRNLPPPNSSVPASGFTPPAVDPFGPTGQP